MNKKDLWALIICNIGLVALVIECVCGLELAFPFTSIWIVVYAITHVVVLKDYLQLSITIEEE